MSQFRNINEKGMQSILRKTAGRLGYISSRGPIAGSGNPSALIEGMGRNEVAMVRLTADEQRLLSAHLDFGLKFSKKRGEDLDALRALVDKIKDSLLPVTEGFTD